MLKKFFALFPEKLSLCAFMIVVLLSCSSIDQNFKNGKTQAVSEEHFKQLSESQKALEKADSSILWPHEKSDLPPDPTHCIQKITQWFQICINGKSLPEEQGEHAPICSGRFYI